MALQMVSKSQCRVAAMHNAVHEFGLARSCLAADSLRKDPIANTSFAANFGLPGTSVQFPVGFHV